jgi:MerR family transcriptional regulator, light-induced transcriptional regulator
MNGPDATPRHPIRVVARRTGLTPATIRAWERRYGAVEPARSEGGQRLYSDLDLERLETLRRLTEMGRSIGSVASLGRDEAAALLREDASAAGDRPLTAAGALETWLEQAYSLVSSLDDAGLERTLWRAFSSMGGPRFLDEVAVPLLRRVGDAWEEGELSPAQEHLGSEVIDRVLAEVADRALPVGNGPRLVVATLPGERHGLGARLVAAAAALEGWTPTYLGTDLPASDIAAAAVRLRARAVAVSMVACEAVAQAPGSLAELRRELPEGVALLVGGRASAELEATGIPPGVRLLDGLEELRTIGLASSVHLLSN